MFPHGPMFRYFGGMADKYEGSVVPVEPGFLNYMTREPIGVVGQIVPWNFPLMFTSWKMGPALAAGNCVVMKPAELTPLTSLRVAELAGRSGVPAGRHQYRAGLGADGGPISRRASASARSGVHGLDGDGPQDRAGLGGQSEAAATGAGRQGREHRVRGRRIDARASNGSAFGDLPQPGPGVHRRLAADAARDASPMSSSSKFIGLAKTIRLGDPLDPETEMGPLTSRRIGSGCCAIRRRARERAARCCSAVRRRTMRRSPRAAMSSRRWCAPSRSTASNRAGGSVRAVRDGLTFGSDEEALQIANSTEYGLGGGLWTTRSVARASLGQARCTAAWCGSTRTSAYIRARRSAASGQSGYGRDMGFEAMREYTQVKSVWVNVDARIPPWVAR